MLLGFLDIYISLCFIYFFQKAEKNGVKKKTVGQNFAFA